MSAITLARVFEGWDGYNTSLIRAVQPLASEQLRWRPTPDGRSVGEVFRHIAFGRIGWFMRMDAPGCPDLVSRIQHWGTDRDGNRHIDEGAFAIADQPAELAGWLEASWSMVDAALRTWTVDDLATTYRHKYAGTVYDVSRQWTTWRIMAHDIHHGGQLSAMLTVQGVEPFELTGLGGHLTEPPVAAEQ